MCDILGCSARWFTVRHCLAHLETTLTVYKQGIKPWTTSLQGEQPATKIQFLYVTFWQRSPEKNPRAHPPNWSRPASPGPGCRAQCCGPGFCSAHSSLHGSGGCASQMKVPAKSAPTKDSFWPADSSVLTWPFVCVCALGREEVISFYRISTPPYDLI